MDDSHPSTSRRAGSAYEFGPYRFDPIDRLLWRNDAIVPLAPKAIDMLLVFVESGGRVLSKDDLMQRLWPDTFVEEANLSHQVYKLREALETDGTKYIETIARRGYRFAAVARRTDVAFAPVGVGSAAGPPAAPDIEIPAALEQKQPGLKVGLYRVGVPWVIAATIAALAAAVWATRSQPEPSPPVHLIVELSATASVVPGLGPAVVLSPNGGVIAFRGRAQPGSPPQIFVRRLDQNEAVPLAGTDNVEEMFFSPDGSWLAFSADRLLKKIPVSGGDAVTLCSVALFRGGDWTADGYIVFASSSRGALSRVRDGGGQPEPLTRLDAATGEITHRFPQVLPGGGAVIYTAHTNSVSYDDAAIMAQPLTGGSPKLVLRGGYAARYVSSGHLLFVRNGALFAIPFDLARLETTGPAALVVDRVVSNVGSAGAQFSVANNGTLVYLQGSGQDAIAPIVWLDGSGRRTELLAPAAYRAPRFSPDGRRLAVQISTGGRSKIWIYDLERGVMTRLTADGNADEVFPLWTPDGNRIVFSSDREEQGKPHLYWKQVDGSDTPARLSTAARTEQEEPGAMLSDGTLIFSALSEQAGTGMDILQESGPAEAAKGGTVPPVPILNTRYAERGAAVSRDGRWLAYDSNETGERQVFVRRLPDLDGKEQISADGGTAPLWSSATRELFYRSADGSRIMVVSVAPGATISAGKPRVWAQLGAPVAGVARNFDLHPDGKRMVVAEVPTSQGRVTTILYQHVFNELRRIAPPGLSTPSR